MFMNVVGNWDKPLSDLYSMNLPEYYLLSYTKAWSNHLQDQAMKRATRNSGSSRAPVDTSGEITSIDRLRALRQNQNVQAMMG